MKSRTELEASLLQSVNSLHKGPRMRSAATNDFEIILRAFISASPPAYTVNRLGEIEVDIKDKIYNLSKIMEHQPDLEHIALTHPTKEQLIEYRNQYPFLANEDNDQKFSTVEEIAELENIANEHFRKLTVYRLALDKEVPVNDRENMVIYEVTTNGNRIKKGELQLTKTIEGLNCRVGSGVDSSIKFMIKWSDLPAEFPRNFANIKEVQDFLPQIIAHMSKVNIGVLTEAEARSIKYLTMEESSNKAYEKINRFSRKNGKISDLMDKTSADLRTIMFELAYLPRAIQKLRDHSSEEMQTVHRGENYETARIANDIIHTRTKNTLLSAPGFISTSEKEKIGKHFSTLGAETAPVYIRLIQLKNSYGVDISLYAENPDEGEVLLMPGTQKIYKLNPENPTELLAIPVRSILDIYSHNYHREVIQLRGEIIKYIDDYSKTAAPDAEFISLLENFCHSIAIYKAGEIIHTLQACRDFLRKAETTSPANDDMRKTQDAIISITKDMEKNLDSILANEVEKTNADLIQAAKYAYKLYYKYPYKDLTLSAADHFVMLNNTKIERPNHGLAHNLRKSLFIPVITNLLQSHATNDDFKNFLSSLDPFKMKILQIALVFSNTGRESEVGATENPKAYNSYREKTQQNFLQYVKQMELYHQNPGEDTVSLEHNKFIEIMGEELRYMGNPGYFEKVSQANFPEKEKDYLYLMLNLAHRLDLMRCFELEEFQTTMDKMNSELSRYVDNEFHSKAMPVLYKMADDSIVATGDRQLVTYDDKITTSKKLYDNHFIVASTKAKKCIGMCIASNPIFSEVSDGKLNVSLPSKKYMASPLQQAALNADMVRINELLTDPKIQTEEFAFLIRFILDICPEIRPASYEPPEDRTISTIHDLNPADTVAALHLALANGKPLQALALIESGVDVTHVNEAGESALYLASQNNLVDIVKALIKVKNNVNLANNNGVSPISIALQSKSWEVVYELLKVPNIILSNAQGNEIFNISTKHNRHDIAALILQNKLPIDISETVYKMKDPLIFATEYDRGDLIELLMKQGPSQVEVKQCMGVAVLANKLDIINVLIKNDSANFIDINAITSNGYTLMHKAIGANHSELLQTLLQHNARIDIVDVYNQQTPISWALKNNQTHMLNIILKHFKEKGVENKISIMHSFITHNNSKAMIDAFNELYSENDVTSINAKSPDTGKTLLHYACEMNCVELIQILLARNPDVNVLDKINITPLVEAAVQGNEQTVRLLIKHGASLQTESVSPLYEASFHQKWNIVKLLIELPHAKDHLTSNIEDSPFTMACRIGEVDILLRMLELGASAEFSPDTDQRFNPLLNAVYFGKTEVVDLLLKLKEVEATRLIDNRSLLTVAAERKHFDVVARLLEVPGMKIDPIVQGKPLILLLVKENRHDLLEKVLPLFSAYLNYIDESGYSALHYAAEAGNVKIIELLIQHGANINAQIKSTQDTHSGMQIINFDDKNTAIDRAVKRSKWDAVKVLLDAKKINPSADEPHFNAPDTFLFAVISSQYDIAERVLLSKNIDIQYISDYKDQGKEQLSTNAMKILAPAVNDGHISFVKSIFEKYPPPNNIIDLSIEKTIRYQQFNMTPLIRHLLDLGFSIHTKNSGLLLHDVVTAKREDLLELLLKNGADTSVRNEKGLTIFEIPDLPLSMTTLLASYKKPPSLTDTKATLFNTDVKAARNSEVDALKSDDSEKKKLT